MTVGLPSPQPDHTAPKPPVNVELEGQPQTDATGTATVTAKVTIGSARYTVTVGLSKETVDAYKAQGIQQNQLGETVQKIIEKIEAEDFQHLAGTEVKMSSTGNKATSYVLQGNKRDSIDHLITEGTTEQKQLGQSAARALEAFSKSAVGNAVQRGKEDIPLTANGNLLPTAKPLQVQARQTPLQPSGVSPRKLQTISPQQPPGVSPRKLQTISPQQPSGVSPRQRPAVPARRPPTVSPRKPPDRPLPVRPDAPSSPAAAQPMPRQRPSYPVPERPVPRSGALPRSSIAPASPTAPPPSPAKTEPTSTSTQPASAAATTAAQSKTPTRDLSTAQPTTGKLANNQEAQQVTPTPDLRPRPPVPPRPSSVKTPSPVIHSVRRQSLPSSSPAVPGLAAQRPASQQMAAPPQLTVPTANTSKQDSTARLPGRLSPQELFQRQLQAGRDQTVVKTSDVEKPTVVKTSDVEIPNDTNLSNLDQRLQECFTTEQTFLNQIKQFTIKREWTIDGKKTEPMTFFQALERGKVITKKEQEQLTEQWQELQTQVQKRCDEWQLLDVSGTSRESKVAVVVNTLQSEQMKGYLHPFGPLINNYNRSLEILTEANTNPTGINLIDQFREYSERDLSLKLSPPDVLITPVQRGPRYELLFKDVMKTLKYDPEDKEKAKAIAENGTFFEKKLYEHYESLKKQIKAI